jgi:hypothetical protein
MYQRPRSTEYDTDHGSVMPIATATCLSFNVEYDFERDPNSASVIPIHSYNADTAQALRDLSLAEQRCLNRGMTVLESQQRLPQITSPEVQERSTVKCIHQ